MKNTILSTLIFLYPIFTFSQNCPPSQNEGFHTIQKGETLYAISRKYNISLADLYSLNSLSEKSILNICQEIKIANKEGNKNDLTAKSGFEMYQKQTGGWHIVQPGERIEKIAELYGYTLAKFRTMNEMEPGERIFVDMKLVSTDCVCSETKAQKEVVKQEIKSTNNTETTEKSGNKNTNSGVLKFNTDNRNFSDNSAEETTSNSVKTIKTPDNLNFLKEEEKEMIAEINLVRSNPVGYIKYIEEYKNAMRSQSNYGTTVQAANELIEELKNTPTLSNLLPIECLYRAAQKHGEDLRKMNKNDHVGSDGSWPWDRVARECTETEKGNENLVGGPDNVRRAVILLLVDNGISSRGHRKTLLNPKWNYVACYKIGKVGYMPNSWVQKFAY